VSDRISARVRSMLRMTMADMADLADARPEAFRLENADTVLVPPEHVLAATRSSVGLDRCNSYLPLRGLPEARQSVAHRYRSDFGLEYDAEGEIVMTSGAGESLLNALLATIDPGDRVLLTNPTYSGMAQRVRLAGGEQVFLDLHEGDRWTFDPGELRERARGCRVVFFASACMPTGTVFTEEETRALADAALENDAILVFNAHADHLAFGGRRVTQPAALPGLRERTLTIGCLSKCWGMPGWRIGWTLGPRELVGALEDTHIFNGIMPSGFAQVGAAAALSDPQDWQRDAVAFYERNAGILVRELGASPHLRVVPPEGGYYFLASVEATGVDAFVFAERLLEEEDVAVTPMAGWGRDDFGRYHVRLIFTNEPPERMAEAGRRIARFADRLAAGGARRG
jgi:aspartate/methionine/tyrosine aminotransferase